MSFCIICVKKLINRFEILDQTGSSAHLIPPSRTTRLVSGGKSRAVPNFQPANGASNVDCLPNHLVDSCQEEGPNTHPPRRTPTRPDAA